jgi:uncharacterized membrane protein YfcA
MSPLVLLLISTVAGLVGAMSGMGGGVVLVPVLTWLGIDIKHAIAASMISVIATSSGSASAYARAHTTNLKVGMFLEMFTIVGAMVGASIAIGAKQNVLAIIFGGILLFSWVVLWFKGNEWHPIKWQDNFSRKLQLEGRYHDSAEHRNIEYRARRAYFGGPLMFGAGLIAGLLGIGAGAVKVLIHDVIMGLPPKVSTTSVYFASGLIEPTIAVPVIPGILAGATVGTFVLQKLTSRAVQRFFLVVLLVLGVEMIYRGLHGLL